MKMLSKEDAKTLATDQKLEVMDIFLSEGLGQDQTPVSPGIEHEIKSPLKTFPQDKAESIAWENAKRRLMP